MAPRIKSQDAAFRQSRKPAPKPKVQQPRNTATGSKVAKNKSRNERRKAARKTATLLKAQGLATRGEKSAENEGKEESEHLAAGKKADSDVEIEG